MMVKFLSFEEILMTKRKTRMFAVYSVHDESHLGNIVWRNGWRRYVMSFNRDCDWSAECMAECYKFIAKLMQERKEKKG